MYVLCICLHLPCPLKSHQPQPLAAHSPRPGGHPQLTFYKLLHEELTVRATTANYLKPITVSLEMNKNKINDSFRTNVCRKQRLDRTKNMPTKQLRQSYRVLLTLSCRLTSAPACSSVFTTFRKPFPAAQWRAVFPNYRYKYFTNNLHKFIM